MFQALKSAKVLDAVTIDSSGNATVRSQALSLVNSDNFSIHLEWTGTPTSTVTIWASNKPDPDEGDNDDDWVQDTSVSITGPAGAAGKFLVEAGNAGSRWYRIKIETSGGTGTFSAWVNAKV